MKVFLFDNELNRVVINEPEVLLIKEFSVLWNNKRNITKEDPTGSQKTRAYRELTYIWLMIDWASPYSEYTEQERHKECLNDAGLTEEEWNDPDFRAACRKYRDLQNSSRIFRMLKAAQNMVDEVTDYFQTVNIQERDTLTGKPIYKVKDIMAEMYNAKDLIDALKTIEISYKKEIEEESELRGSGEEGFLD